jgi:ubiquinone/menaquinone biosynthesis C-methylase UbiE
MKWFKEGLSPYQTTLAMIGAKRGQKILVIGAGSGPIAAEVALVAGLNGRVLVVDRNPATQAAVESAAAKAGALIEFERASSSMLAVVPEAFDIAVLHEELGALSLSDARLAVAEARRVLRPGGRAIVMEKTSRPGLFGLIRVGPAREPPLPPSVAIDLLKGEGFLAVRLLADAEGTAYVEGRR